jgi:hypothetical protein
MENLPGANFFPLEINPTHWAALRHWNLRDYYPVQKNEGIESIMIK